MIVEYKKAYFIFLEGVYSIDRGLFSLQDKATLRSIFLDPYSLLV